jgi:hypothetical protein
MKKRLINKLIENTENDNILSVVKKEFRNYIPKTLEIVLNQEKEESRIELADTMDCFEYHFRGYVCGKFNRMHRIYFELRRIEKTIFAKECILLMFDHIESLLVENEIYEFMDRFITAKQKCTKLLNEINKKEIDIENLKKTIINIKKI